MKDLHGHMTDSICRVAGHRTDESEHTFSVQRPDKSLHRAGDKTRSTLWTHACQSKSHQSLCPCTIRKELAPKPEQTANCESFPPQ